MQGLAEVQVSGQMVRAGAGARWDAVLAESLRHGLAPPVLTDYLGLSVGGTLSMGGVGGQSFRQGLQTDHVDELTVVTGSGELATCSRRERADLFDACRAGIGQCAIILSARLRLVEAPSTASVVRLRYENLSSLLSDQRALHREQRFDYALGSLLPRVDRDWGYALELVRYGFGRAPADLAERLQSLRFIPGSAEFETVTYAEHAGRLASMEQGLRQTAMHPWMDLLLPAARAEELVAFALALLDPALLANGGHVMIYGISGSQSSTPLLELPGGEDALLFDILPTVFPGDTHSLHALELTFARIWQRARELGGRVYPIGFPVSTPFMTAADWEHQFGRAWPRFVAAKRAFDPDGLLTPVPRIPFTGLSARAGGG